jgi:iron-sulfur cluster repair protein YtfE (RIC family)
VNVLTRLGAPAAPEDSAGLVLECHERIRFFLALARRVAGAGPRDPDVAEAAARVARYFREALPLHAQDEEESILPRLRGREEEVDLALGEMAREHAAHAAPLAALVGACDALARDPGRLGALSSELAAVAAGLEAHFATHLGREETVIVPAMRRLLSRDEDAAIVRELRARRGA